MTSQAELQMENFDMADFDIGVATVSGLDDSFDKVIRGLPENLLRGGFSILQPDDDAPDRLEQLHDPFTTMGHVRDQGMGVVLRGADGTYAGLKIQNIFLHDLSRPHAVALSHAAVSEIGSDRIRFVNEGAYGEHGEAHGRTINTLDGPDHRSLRRLFDSAIFGRRAMEEWTTAITLPTIEYLVRRVKRMIADGETPDARRDLAMPAAYKSISTILGIPQDGFADFLGRVEVIRNVRGNATAAKAAMVDLDGYFADRMHERQIEPKPDMISIMSNVEIGGRKLTEEEVTGHCAFLLPGGIETTWPQAANLIMCALLYPDQYRAVVEDPSLVDSFVEEALRWSPSGFAAPRICAEDTVVEGVEIPAGTGICSMGGVANRDPKVFEHPDTFDLRRSPNPHLTFHIGVHFCMGQNLARYILRTLLATLARELPTLQLAGDRRELEAEAYGGRRYPRALLLTA
jgi:cytochrome P450